MHVAGAQVEEHTLRQTACLQVIAIVCSLFNDIGSSTSCGQRRLQGARACHPPPACPRDNVASGGLCRQSAPGHGGNGRARARRFQLSPGLRSAVRVAARLWRQSCNCCSSGTHQSHSEWPIDLAVAASSGRLNGVSSAGRLGHLGSVTARPSAGGCGHKCERSSCWQAASGVPWCWRQGACAATRGRPSSCRSRQASHPADAAHAARNSQ